MRHVVQREFSHDLIACANDRDEVVQAKRVGRAHRRDDAGDAAAAATDLAQRRQQLARLHLIVVPRRHLDDVLLADAQPVCNRSTGVVRAV